MKDISRSLLALGLFLTGCGSEQPEPIAEGPAEDSAASNPSGRAVATGFVMSPTGAGDLRIGMTIEELSAHLVGGSDASSLTDGCHYVTVESAPDSTLFMVEGGVLARIDVRGGPTATAEGARIGDTEARILSLYPGARTMPHKYTDGHYLVVVPGAPSDTVHRYVFETDGQSVTNYRAGAYPQVEWVEGCG